MATAMLPDAAPPDAFPAYHELLDGELRLNLSALGVDASIPDFDQVLIRLSEDNEPYVFEFTAQGELAVIPLLASASVVCKGELCGDLGIWRRTYGGVAYAMRCLYHLPGGALLTPNASWITQERYDALTRRENQGAINGAPDFVGEVLAPYDTTPLPQLLTRMTDWMNAGVKLAWLIDAYARRAYIYRAGQTEPDILDNPATLSGENVLPGFVFPVGQLIFDRYGKELEE